MKALVLEEYNHFIYKDVPEPVIGTNDVLVRVAACGICGSDVYMAWTAVPEGAYHL